MNHFLLLFNAHLNYFPDIGQCFINRFPIRVATFEYRTTYNVYIILILFNKYR